jgi:hypothetical protein
MSQQFLLPLGAAAVRQIDNGTTRHDSRNVTPGPESEVDRRWRERLARYDVVYQRTRELCVGDQVFVRADVMAKSIGMRYGRLYDWIRHGTPNGYVLKAMQTTCFPRRYYLDKNEQDQLLNHLPIINKRQRTRSAPGPS